MVLYRLFPSFPMSAVKRCDSYVLEVSSTVPSTRPAAIGTENDTTTPNLGMTQLATRAANPGRTRLKRGTLLRRFRHRVRPNHRPTSQPETRTWDHDATTQASTLAAIVQRLLDSSHQFKGQPIRCLVVRTLRVLLLQCGLSVVPMSMLY